MRPSVQPPAEAFLPKPFATAGVFSIVKQPPHSVSAAGRPRPWKSIMNDRSSICDAPSLRLLPAVWRVEGPNCMTVA